MMIRRSSSLIASSYLNYPATKKIIRILEEDYSIDPDDYSAILKTVDNYLKSINSSTRRTKIASSYSSLSDYQKDLISDLVKAELETGNPVTDYNGVYNMIMGDFDDDFAGVTREAVEYYIELINNEHSNFEEYELASSLDMEESTDDDFDNIQPDFDLDALESTVNLIKQNYPCYIKGDAKQIAQDFNLSDKEAEYVLSQLKEKSVKSSNDNVKKVSKKKSKYNGCNVTGREGGMAPQAEAPSGGLF